MAKEKGLGRGLGLGAMFGDAALIDNETSSLMIPIAHVEPNAEQPRKNFNGIEELAESIRRYGIIQPLTVRRLSNGQYQIIAGERRWRAAREAGLVEVPAVVIEADDLKAAELALIENLQREDLDPMEEAEGYRVLIDSFGLSQEEAASRVGKSRPAVTNALRLLSLPEELKKLVSEGKLSAGHGRTLLSLKRKTDMSAAAKKVMEEDLSVRQTEALCKKLNGEVSEKKTGKQMEIDYAAIAAEELTGKLGRKVVINNGRKKGTLVLEYYGNDDLQHLLSQLETLAAKGATE